MALSHNTLSSRDITSCIKRTEVVFQEPLGGTWRHSGRLAGHSSHDRKEPDSSIFLRLGLQTVVDFL